MTPAEFAEAIRPASALVRPATADRNSSKLTSWIVVALLLAAGYYAGSPYLAVAMMRRAGQEGDYASMNEYIDYARLRENFKGQFNARLVKQVTNGRSDAGTGLALAPLVIDQMIDAFVTPEGVASMLEGADAEEAKEGKKFDAKTDEPSTITQGYVGGLSRFAVRIESDDVMTTVIFRRSGFATWKLTEVELPDDAFQ
jgi:hypothetical protein